MFGDRLAIIGSGLAVREGYSGSFFTGALVTLVASPCTVPFMAAAMGYAISWTKKLMPVALPPGRARLATRPSVTGSLAIGIVAQRAWRSRPHDGRLGQPLAGLPHGGDKEGA
jgi:hypothetical protein